MLLRSTNVAYIVSFKMCWWSLFIEKHILVRKEIALRFWTIQKLQLLILNFLNLFTLNDGPNYMISGYEWCRVQILLKIQLRKEQEIHHILYWPLLLICSWKIDPEIGILLTLNSTQSWSMIAVFIEMINKCHLSRFWKCNWTKCLQENAKEQ